MKKNFPSSEPGNAFPTTTYLHSLSSQFRGTGFRGTRNQMDTKNQNDFLPTSVMPFSSEICRETIVALAAAMLGPSQAEASQSCFYLDWLGLAQDWLWTST